MKSRASHVNHTFLPFTMTVPTENPPTKKSSSAGTLLINFLAGFPLATVLMVLLLLQTWLATLEQVDHGLHATLRKYFDPSAFWIRAELVLPDFMGEYKWIIPLPGGYWVLALLFVNLVLGGIIRMRKGWRVVGVLISHFGIVFMVLSAGVTELKEERGTMDFFEGETSNVAQDYYEYVVEVTERTKGIDDKVHVIRGEYLQDLHDDLSLVRTVQLPALPFDMEFTRFAKNSRVMSVNEMAPPKGEPVIDGYFVFERPSAKDAETNVASVYAKILPRDGATPSVFIASGSEFYPYTAKVGERVFTFTMRKFLWRMPFSVRLDKATAEYYPNSMKPKRFESRVTRIENGSEAIVEIKMNEPMRYEGLTFYQRMMGRENAQMANSRPYSQLEVVRNPADQWPKYSLYIVTFGLFVHFVMKFANFLSRTLKKNH